MGNRVCYKPGKKFGNMLQTILTKPYDPTLTTHSRAVKEFIDYLENDFSKLPKVPSYVSDRLSRRRQQLTPDSLNMLLNSFQLFIFVLQSAVKLNNARLEISRPNTENVKIKMDVRKFDFLERLHLKKTKKRKIDSQFLLHFLPFQEKTFKMTEDILGDEFPFPDSNNYSPHLRELIFLILEYFSHTFRIWSIFGLKNFSNQVQEIFQMLIKKAKIFVGEARCLQVAGDVFLHMPMRMYKPTQYEILVFLQATFYAAQANPALDFQTVIQKLLKNLLKKRKQKFVLDILSYYPQAERRMIGFFISAAAEQPELEPTILEFLIDKLGEDDEYLPILIVLLRKCSVDLLNTTNFNRLTDYLFTLLPKQSIREEEKREFLTILFAKSQRNFYIGRYNFFKNVFVKLKAKPRAIHTFCDLFQRFPLGTTEVLKPHDVIDKILVKLVFEIVAIHKEFVSVFVMMLEGDQERIAEQGLRELAPEILRRLQPELELHISLLVWTPQELLDFAKMMKAFIFLQLFLGTDTYTRREYVHVFTELLMRVQTLDVFLVFVLCLFQFERRFDEDEAIIEIIRKYDTLLERPVYRRVFGLMDPNVLGLDPRDSIVELIKTENNLHSKVLFNKDTEEISRILHKEYRLSGFKSQVEYRERSPEMNRASRSVGPDHSSFLGAESRGYIELNEDSAETSRPDFQEVFRKSLQRNLKKQDFMKKMERSSEQRSGALGTLSSVS
jgi:hypothetical protein